MNLTHIKKDGSLNMVDVSSKEDTLRTATVSGSIYINKEGIKLIKENNIKKGDVLTVAKTAGIMGAKQTSYLIPLTHNILIDNVDIDIQVDEDKLTVFSTARSTGKTGVEMEALVGCNIALMTIYDMVKAVDKNMVIGDIRLLKKTGGKSGEYTWQK